MNTNRSVRLIGVIAACIVVALQSVVGAYADEYKMGPDDLLHISVFNHPEMELNVRISQSGNITVPLLGVVQVAGLSTQQAESLLNKKLIDGAYIKQAQVSINVIEYQSQKVSVIGQVNKPGQYALTGTQKVLDILSQAGGLLPDSAADTATLIRQDGNVYTLDLHKLLAGDRALNADMLAGDTLSIPQAADFYIYGEVQHPGRYKLERDTTVSQAISIGGGLTLHGTERRAIIKRRDEKGKEQKYSARPSDVLRADDVLMIKESLF